MSKSSFVTYILEEVLGEIFGITSHAMFGGYGIYKDGVITGLVANDKFYLKVGESNKADYEEKGSTPFTYSGKNGKVYAMSYWEVPYDIIEDKRELNDWIEKSYRVSIDSRKK